MTRPTRLEINCETGEQTFIELTDAEIEANEAATEAYLADKAEAERVEAEKQAAKNAVYAKLGLTADEVAALLA